MINNAIERVADKRHQRLLNAGVNEAIADQILTQDLLALKWQYRVDDNMLHDAIERVAYKRHQRLINAGVKESIADQIVTQYLIALKANLMVDR